MQRWNELGDLQDELEYDYYAGTNRLKNIGEGRVDGNGDKVYEAGAIEPDGVIYRKITIKNTAFVPAGANVELFATESIDMDPDFKVEDGAEFEATLVEPDAEGAQNFFVYEYDAIGNTIWRKH